MFIATDNTNTKARDIMMPSLLLQDGGVQDRFDWTGPGISKSVNIKSDHHHEQHIQPISYQCG